jgi:hypothetical protein
METATASTPAPGATPSDDKAKAQPESGKTKLDEIQAQVKESAHAAGQDIARHVHDLEKTNAKHVARAKRNIKADVAKVKKATRKLGDKFKKTQ